MIKKVEKHEKINPMKELKAHNDLLSKLTNELEEQGVEFFRPTEIGGKLEIDSDFLTLPKDITNVNAKHLGQYLNVFTQQRMYMRTLLSWQEVALDEIKRAYYDVSNDLYEKLTLNKMSETAKERILNNDPIVKPVFMQYKDAKKKMLLLQYNLASIEDAVFLISREISRRTGDYDKETRNENIQRR